jgi:hypothetical protein
MFGRERILNSKGKTVSETTKRVRITLAALTRVEYTEIIEVPIDTTGEELDSIVDQRYNDVDGGEYHDDPHFWDRAQSCGHEELDAARGADSDEAASLKFSRSAAGDLTEIEVLATV